MSDPAPTYAYVVEIQPGCWLAPWTGDPGRTEVLSSAKQYETGRAALRALTAARKYRAMPTAKVRCVRMIVELVGGPDV